MEQAVFVSVPPWAAMAAVIGAMHGAAFHLLFGNRLLRLPTAVGLGLVASVMGGLVGTMIPPALLAIGETNLIATAVGAWMALGVARVFRFV
jgi:hypothetical protein